MTHIIYGNKVSHARFHPNGECYISKARPVVEVLDAAMNVIIRIEEPADMAAAAEAAKGTGFSLRYAR